MQDRATQRWEELQDVDEQPIITLQGTGVDWDKPWRNESSILVPLQYYNSYNTYSIIEMEDDENLVSSSVRTVVFRSVSKTLTGRLYRHYSKQEEERMTWVDPQTKINYFTPVEAALWGADEGMAIVAPMPCPYTMELFLRREKTLLWLSIKDKDVDMEFVKQAVLKFWDELAP